MMEDNSNAMMKSGSSIHHRRRMSHGSLVGLKTVRCLDDLVTPTDECSDTLASSGHEVDNTISVSRKKNRRRSSRATRSTRRSISIGESRMDMVDPFSFERLKMMDGSNKSLSDGLKNANARRRKSESNIRLCSEMFSEDLLGGEEGNPNEKPINSRRRKSDGLFLLPSSIDVMEFDVSEEGSDDDSVVSEGVERFSDSDISVNLDLSELSNLDSSNDDHCSKRQEASAPWRRTMTL